MWHYNGFLEINLSPKGVLDLMWTMIIQYNGIVDHFNVIRNIEIVGWENCAISVKKYISLFYVFSRDPGTSILKRKYQDKHHIRTSPLYSEDINDEFEIPLIKNTNRDVKSCDLLSHQLFYIIIHL
jgi:hypothetical protein